jgi:hypothetical protein
MPNKPNNANKPYFIFCFQWADCPAQKQTNPNNAEQTSGGLKHRAGGLFGDCLAIVR